MSTKDIAVRILNAQLSPATLSRIAEVLDGKDVHTMNVPNIATITLSEAARRLNVSRPTIYRMKELGKIKTVKLCGVDRVFVSSLLSLDNGQS